MGAFWWTTLIMLFLLAEQALATWDRASLRRLEAAKLHALPPVDAGEKESE